MLYEYTVLVEYQTIDQSIESLNAAGLYNLYYEPPIEIIKVQNGYDYEERQQEFIELKIYAEEGESPGLPETYLSLIENTLGIAKDEIRLARIDDTSWDVSFEDIDLGNGWVLCYSGQTDVHPGKKILRFDPQAAFGTGLHATTQDCLRIILSENLNDKSVLDLGTGSGVLSIAAALKGAEKVTAVDYEPVEREIRLNAELNKVDIPLSIEQADLLEGEYSVTEPFDVIVINIGADETRKIVERHQLVDKSDTFLISGVVEWNAGQVMEMFKKEGYSAEVRMQTDEWLTFLFKKGKS
ncbi:50S ribosomal protein L11 methyltransferase [Sediminibacillus massiliensis]|uniref:50S ribosomal protein L11 methyltransferase n=1 Tax=Sediminibacillus massiliensis TaxID=1926277 RepID=UPI00098890BB|nr:50S ribosomal protein L11 methyltransferase [Sediminibacillus massiliensis]